MHVRTRSRLKPHYCLSLFTADPIHAPPNTAPALMAAATVSTIGQMVPGPIQNNTTAIPEIAPTHSANAKAHGLAGRHKATNKANANSIRTIGGTPLPEFNHHPLTACKDTTA